MTATVTTTDADGPAERLPTRERILAAAFSQFIDRGVAGVTITDLERAVGLAPGTGSFYRHFRSKDEVLHASFEYGVDRLVEGLVARRYQLAQETEDPTERAAAVYRNLLGTMNLFMPVWTFIATERSRHPELERIFLERSGMVGWDLGWDRDPVPTIALAALTGFQTLSLLDGAPFADIDTDAFVAALVELTLGGSADPTALTVSGPRTEEQEAS